MLHGTASEAPLYAVCYDVSDDRERRKVDKLLKGYGFRAQKSVFECHLTATQKQTLFSMLERMSLKTGHIRAYRVYAESKARTFGTATPALPDDSFTYGV
jgi:CRISPR-associated protein Cas2